MGDRLVRTSGAPVAQARLDELPPPTWRLFVARGMPQFAAEALLPVAAFYAAWRVYGLGAGIAVSTVISVALAVVLVRSGRDVGLVVVGAVFVVVQAAVGLASGSATVYLAQPVLLSALWGVAYLVSVLVGRPLIGVFACAWYPFPAVVSRERSVPPRVCAAVAGVGCVLLARAALRLVFLLHSGVGAFVLVSFVTGTPVIAALIAWGLWHARRSFARLETD